MYVFELFNNYSALSELNVPLTCERFGFCFCHCLRQFKMFPGFKSYYRLHNDCIRHDVMLVFTSVLLSD